MTRWVGGARAAVLTAAIMALAAVATGGEPTAVKGKQLFTEHGCYGCHMIGKFGTPIAPDLSRVGSKRTRDDLVRWLRDPSSQKPTAHMPRIALSEEEAAALAAYLASLR